MGKVSFCVNIPISQGMQRSHHIRPLASIHAGHTYSSLVLILSRPAITSVTSARLHIIAHGRPSEISECWIGYLECQSGIEMLDLWDLTWTETTSMQIPVDELTKWMRMCAVYSRQCFLNALVTQVSTLVMTTRKWGEMACHCEVNGRFYVSPFWNLLTNVWCQ